MVNANARLSRIGMSNTPPNDDKLIMKTQILPYRRAILFGMMLKLFDEFHIEIIIKAFNVFSNWIVVGGNEIKLRLKRLNRSSRFCTNSNENNDDFSLSFIVRCDSAKKSGINNDNNFYRVHWPFWPNYLDRLDTVEKQNN
ncbi:hypothetical protein DERP_007162 [Dermatophagoides pteronyssinus]|uniref:Uncharacterized protein n=1 Tax=Dermatophagoides pteronyssinus TaxID=6956 RepID=A0ABQ8JVE8_DERPT|nr:hypothetical protein DERP_007162 [Dermatophagoides pteronyssinus]